MEKNDNYFVNKSEAEKLRNVSSLVNDIVNSKPEESLEVQDSSTETKEEVPEVINPVVDMVGKAISQHNPNKGNFFQGVQSDGNPKL
jgi:hypothetical protein